MRASTRAGALTLLVSASLAGCSTASPTPPPAPTTPAAAFACADPVVSPLPEWARTGFTPPDQDVAHIASVQGHVVAVPFGWPLREKQPEGRSNKVLWVADLDTGGPLVIEARRESDTDSVRREVADGPGPSIIDLPGKGCWQLDLSWPGGADRVYLRYLGPVA
jgi:hypothetical protein